MLMRQTRTARTRPIDAGSPPAKGFRRALYGTATAALLAALLVIFGLACFAIPPDAENRAAATDAIVVLTGGSLRLQSGIDLLREGKARALFVSGVDRRVDLDELLRIAGSDAPSWLACCVTIGYQAQNTSGNAAETAQWMRRRGYHSLRLVTSWYHMPRSLLEFERAMPGIGIIPHPVFPEQVRDSRWWAWRGTAALLIAEYAKYLAALLLPVVEPDSHGSTHPFETEARR